MPCTVVSIEVAEYNGVVVGMSEDRVDIKRVASGARRSRRRVEVEENDVGFVDLKADGLPRSRMRSKARPSSSRPWLPAQIGPPEPIE